MATAEHQVVITGDTSALEADLERCLALERELELLTSVTQTQIISVHPGDVILARLDAGHYDGHDRERIREQLRAIFPENEVMIASCDVEISTIRPEDTP